MILTCLHVCLQSDHLRWLAAVVAIAAVVAAGWVVVGCPRQSGIERCASLVVNATMPLSDS